MRTITIDKGKYIYRQSNRVWGGGVERDRRKWTGNGNKSSFLTRQYAKRITGGGQETCGNGKSKPGPGGR